MPSRRRGSRPSCRPRRGALDAAGHGEVAPHAKMTPLRHAAAQLERAVRLDVAGPVVEVALEAGDGRDVDATGADARGSRRSRTRAACRPPLTTTLSPISISAVFGARTGTSSPSHGAAGLARRRAGGEWRARYPPAPTTGHRPAPVRAGPRASARRPRARRLACPTRSARPARCRRGSAAPHRRARRARCRGTRGTRGPSRVGRRARDRARPAAAAARARGSAADPRGGSVRRDGARRRGSPPSRRATARRRARCADPRRASGLDGLAVEHRAWPGGGSHPVDEHDDAVLPVEHRIAAARVGRLDHDAAADDGQRAVASSLAVSVRSAITIHRAYRHARLAS